MSGAPPDDAAVNAFVEALVPHLGEQSRSHPGQRHIDAILGGVQYGAELASAAMREIGSHAKDQLAVTLSRLTRLPRQTEILQKMFEPGAIVHGVTPHEALCGLVRQLLDAQRTWTDVLKM